MAKFDSLEALTEFFDEKDMGDYLEKMPEAHFEVSLNRRMYFVAVDEEILGKLSEISKQKHLPSETIYRIKICFTGNCGFA